jgi:predicted nucleic acid-binding protein
MVLVDTSVWVAHLREGSPELERLLLDSEVVCHPYIIGELACGTLKNRNQILSLLQSLPLIQPVDYYELLHFIEINRLVGLGIGFVDVHLLASAKMAGISLWTLDRRLKSAAKKLKIAYK